MWLVQGQMGIVLADYADRSDPSDSRPRPRRREARVRCNDEHEKIDIAVIEAASRA